MRTLEMIRADISALEADIASPERVTLRLQSLGRLWRDKQDIADAQKRIYTDAKERADNARALLAKAREDEQHTLAHLEELRKQAEHAERLTAGMLAAGRLAEAPTVHHQPKVEKLRITYSLALALTKAPNFPADFAIHLLRSMSGNGASFEEAIVVAEKMTGKNPFAAAMPAPKPRKVAEKVEKPKRAPRVDFAELLGH